MEKRALLRPPVRPTPPCQVAPSRYRRLPWEAGAARCSSCCCFACSRLSGDPLKSATASRLRDLLGSGALASRPPRQPESPASHSPPARQRGPEPTPPRRLRRASAAALSAAASATEGSARGGRRGCGGRAAGAASAGGGAGEVPLAAPWVVDARPAADDAGSAAARGPRIITGLDLRQSSEHHQVRAGQGLGSSGASERTADAA